MLGGSVGYQDIGGRITRHWLRKHEKVEDTSKHRDITTTLRWMDAMGVDYACLFPTPMLFLGTHPQVEVEVSMARAYNRWLCEQILATARGWRIYGSPLLRRLVLCASAAISKAERISSLSPGLSLAFRDRNRARYSLRINFFSWSSVRLYFGIAATVSISIHYEFTKKSLALHALQKCSSGRPPSAARFQQQL